MYEALILTWVHSCKQGYFDPDMQPHHIPLHESWQTPTVGRRMQSYWEDIASLTIILPFELTETERKDELQLTFVKVNQFRYG